MGGREDSASVVIGRVGGVEAKPQVGTVVWPCASTHIRASNGRMRITRRRKEERSGVFLCVSIACLGMEATIGP
jgi:hypothetical protein